MKTKNFLFLFAVFLFLYLLASGFSYAVFSYFNKSEVVIIESPLPNGQKKPKTTVVSDLPKTEECPLNGEKYTKPEKEWWGVHRPLGIMIENHAEARPQSGLSKADIIYEAVAEGGITRFLAVYYCQDAEQTGPVRSARTYFLDFISEYGENPLYAHVGGANTPGPANALGQISDYGWTGRNDLNQFSIGFPTFWRDYERLGHPVATEHTMYSTTEKLWETGKKRNFTDRNGEGERWDENFSPWIFKEDVSEKERPQFFSAEFNFWEGYDNYKVKWEFDRSLNNFRRFNGGQTHVDKNNDVQLTAGNVVLVFMAERNADDGYENNAHLLYGTKGKGNGILLRDGVKEEIEWRKKERKERMRFYEKKTGKEIEFNRGQIWIEILPLGATVNYG